MVGLFILLFAVLFWTDPACAVTVGTVQFRSADGITVLISYIFVPAVPGLYSVVVMLRGRAGSYTLLKLGQHDTDALIMRKKCGAGFGRSAATGPFMSTVSARAVTAMVSSDILTIKDHRKSASRKCGCRLLPV